MQYRRLGSSGLQVSAVSLGGWITFGGTIEEGVARAIVRRAVEGGVNFIDLADVYALGEAEKVFGRMLADHTRENLILSSKVFFPCSEDPNDRGLTRKHIMQSVERSLRNLRTEFLDFYFCHREDEATPLEETIRAMDDLVHQGKVLYWGTSCWSASTLAAAHSLADRRHLYPPMVEQPEYNLLERGIEKDVLPAASGLGMGVVVWSPLAGGILTGKYDDGVPAGSRAKTTSWLEGKLTPETLRRVKKFGRIAARLDLRPEQLALAWILQRPEITSVITGASRPEQVSHNLAALDVVLPADARSEIEALFPGP
ncbi:MAG: aldo/keto reductase family protein [Planctomycetota bacterium]